MHLIFNGPRRQPLHPARCDARKIVLEGFCGHLSNPLAVSGTYPGRAIPAHITPCQGHIQSEPSLTRCMREQMACSLPKQVRAIWVKRFSHLQPRIAGGTI